MATRTRLQIDLDEQTIALLSDLRDRIPVASRAEVLRYALHMFAWAAGHAAQGRKIAAIGDHDDDHPLEVLALPGVLPVLVGPGGH